MGDILTNYDILGAFWMTIQLTVLLGHRRAGPRHRAGRHAGLPGARSLRLARHALRQRLPQHPADAASCVFSILGRRPTSSALPT